MFAKQKILRIYTFAVWLVFFSYIQAIFRTRILGSALLLVFGVSATLIIVSETKVIPILIRAAILMLMIIQYSFYITYDGGYLFFTPIILVLVTIATSTFLSRPLLVFVSTVWNLTFLAFFVLFPERSFKVFTPSECLYFFVIMECAVFFSYIFIGWANERLRHSEMLTEKAKTANRAKGEFLANMSQEIKTPVDAIIGAAERMMPPDAGVSVKDIQSNALLIKKSGATLINLIDDILEISKIEQGGFEISEAPYDVSSMICGVVEIIDSKIAGKPFKLLTDLNIDDEPELIGDSRHIKRILLHILSNSVKYADQGNILLKVGQSYTSDGVNLNISVSNSGFRVKAEGRAKTFSPFRRFSRNKNTDGDCPELPITKSFLDAMGATIKLENIRGEGSRVTLVIPQKCPPNKLCSAPARFKVINTKILIVDDNKVNLTVTTGLFKLYNITADTADSGMEALDMVTKTRYDIIYMDHMMPGMDGILTTAAIRRLDMEWCKTVPIVALTANAIAGMERFFLDSGMNAFVSKPIDLAELERTLLMFVDPKNIIEEAAGRSSVSDEPSGDVCELEIEGLDIARGMEYCGGSYDGYIEVLETYHYNIPAQLEVMESSYEKGDICRLTIEAHSLKSASKGIGAEKLGEMAYSMEKAGKANDSAYIDANIAQLLEEYRSVGENIGKALNNPLNQTKPARGIVISDLLDELNSIIEYTGNYDLNAAKITVDGLMEYNIDKSAFKRLVQIKSSIMQFSYTDTIEQTKALVEELSIRVTQ